MKNEEIDIEKLLKEKAARLEGAKVFCVSCGARKRTLRKWHNSYLCSECFRIAERVGDEQFIKALKGEDKS